MAGPPIRDGADAQHEDRRRQLAGQEHESPRDHRQPPAELCDSVVQGPLVVPGYPVCAVVPFAEAGFGVLFVLPRRCRIFFVVTSRSVVIVVIVVLFIGLLWLSTKMESARESLSTRAAAKPASSETTGSAEPTTTVHHAEENLWVNTTVHSATATTAEHVRWVHQVLATVVTGAFPTHS